MGKILFMHATIGQVKWVAAGKNVPVLDPWPGGFKVDPSARALGLMNRAVALETRSSRRSAQGLQKRDVNGGYDGEC